jgi:hypothetical protein
MKQLANRIHELADAIEGCQWELPITANYDLAEAARVIEAVDRAGFRLLMCVSCRQYFLARTEVNVCDNCGRDTN